MDAKAMSQTQHAGLTASWEVAGSKTGRVRGDEEEEEEEEAGQPCQEGQEAMRTNTIWNSLTEKGPSPQIAQ